MSENSARRRAQTTRLVSLYLKGEEVKPKPYRRHRFPQRYTREDIELLAGRQRTRGAQRTGDTEALAAGLS